MYRRLNVLDHDSHFLTAARAPGKLVEIGHTVRRPVVDGGSTIVGGEITTQDTGNVIVVGANTRLENVTNTGLISVNGAGVGSGRDN